MSEPSDYKLSEASKILKISFGTLIKYVKSGELKTKKVDWAYYVTESDLMAFIDAKRYKHS